MTEAPTTIHHRRPVSNDAADRLPPHSLEAEQGVLGCILLDPRRCLSECAEQCKAGADVFYDLKHQVIYDAMLAMRAKGDSIDIGTLFVALKQSRDLESIGGHQYLASLPDLAGSAANLKYYLDVVIGKFARRRVIQAAQSVIDDAENDAIEPDEFVTESQRRLVSTFHELANGSAEDHWTVDDLMAFDVDRDPNAVVGLDPKGRTTRYLCRGYGMWLIGPSGVGKSSLIVQMAICFALHRPFFGTWAVRPLRVLIVQAENDIGDAAEEIKGIAGSMGIDPFVPEFDMLRDRVKFVTERRTVGVKFCSWLERQIAMHRADVVMVDPFLSFAGIDVSRQDQCTQFLRTALNPVLADTGVVLIASHHTGKPKDAKHRAGWTMYDHAYEGIGSSELVNWARAVSVMQPVEDGVFKLLMAKRGRRAWATHPGGEPTTTLWLRHAQHGIAWEQAEAPEQVEPDERSKKPSKSEQLSGSNLYSIISTIPPGGESARSLATRLSAESKRLGFSVSEETCRKTVLDLLIKCDKLSFNTTAQTYSRGANA